MYTASNIVATAQTTLNGDPYVFLFYGDCAVWKYNLNTGVSIRCMNMAQSATVGVNSGGLSAAASLATMLKTLGLVK